MRRVFRAALALSLVGCGAAEDLTTEPDTDVGFDSLDVEAEDVAESDGFESDADTADAPDDLDAGDVDALPADTEGDAIDAITDVSDVDVDPVDAETDVPVEDTAPDADIEPDPDVTPDVDEPDVADAWFSLGLGEESFAPVVEGQDAFMAQGIQGGFHVWGAFQGAGFEPEGYSLEVTLRSADTLVGAVFYDRALETNDAGDFEAVAVTVFIAPEVIPELEDGAIWEYCATLTATDGFSANQCATITARCCDYLDF